MIYDPNGIYQGGVGKDSPYGKSTGQFRPRLAGRYSGIVSGAYQVGRFLFKNRRRYQGVGIVATGAGVRYATRNQQRKAYRSVSAFRGYSRYSRSNFSRKGSCCCKCKPSNRSSRRRFS